MDLPPSADLNWQMSAKEAAMNGKAVTRWVVILTAIGSLMAALDTLVVSTALNRIRLDLGASVGQLEWTVNAYNLSFAVLLITGAALGDRYGRRNLYAAGLALSSGPLVGGAVVQGIDWQWIFWVNVPIGLAAIPLVLTRMRESYGPDTALDLRGLALVTLGALGTVWGLVRGNQAGWGSAEVVATLIGGVLLMVAFVAWERRAREPMLSLELFRSRAFSAGNAAIFLTFASLFGAVFFFAQLLQTGLGSGPLDTGLRLLPWTATFITVAPLAGALADKIGERPLMVAGLSLQALGSAWLALIADADMAYTQMLAPFIVAGVGVSMAIPAAQNSVVASVADDVIGKAAGANSMMRELGGVFGVAVAGAVFAAAGSYAPPSAFVEGFHPPILLGAALA